MKALLVLIQRRRGVLFFLMVILMIGAAPAALGQAPIFTDNFNAGALDLAKWNKGANTGNQSSVISNQLELRSSGSESGWVITKNSYAARNTAVSVKVTQPNNDGDLGVSPTHNLSSTLGIYNENNWYRFYVYGSGPYRLFAQWKKSGVVNGLDVTGNLVITGAVYLRLRFDNANIHFEASLDGVNWTDTYTEAFGLPGYTLDSPFYYELAAYKTTSNGVLTVDDFAINSSTPIPDTQPPQISAVTAQNISSSGAQIVWQTDEAADSQVEYGLTTSYGISTPLDPTLATSHAVALSGLQTNTLYHYRVKSKDAAGNLATSNDFTFTTPAPSSAIFADDFNVATLDLTKWNKGSNSGNQSAVVSNQLQLQSSGSVSGWVITKNSYAARNTAVSVKVTQPNNDGDLGLSPTYNLASTLGIFNETNWYRFYVYSSGPYRLFAQWKKSGVVNGVDVTGNLVINGAVYLRLRFDNTNIHFEASLDGVNWTDTYAEAFGLPGYTLDSPFYYELAAYKTTSNGLLRVDDFAINGSTPIPDTQPPQISAVTAQNVSNNSAQIVWQTDEPADSQVEYGLTTSYGLSTPLDPALVTSHTVTLSGLQANTTYHYRVKSKDAAGNLAVGNDQTFQTSAAALAFTDITVAAGTGGPTDPDSTGGHAAIFADVDSDARPDLYITMYNVPETPATDLFFRNVNGSVFAEEGNLRGIDDLDGGSHGACFADLDNDGDYDLYNGTTRSAPGILGINNIYRNNGGGFFTDVSGASGIPIREWETRAVIAFDMEGDGDLDLFSVTDFLGTNDPPADRNGVYRNDGNLRFTSIDSGALFLALAGQGATDTDFDGDGDIDVITANRTGPVNLLRNDGQGNFTLVAPTSIGINHSAGDGITTADVDNDGDLDMLLASDDLGHLYRNAGGTFSFVQSFSNTDGYMGSFADVDNDGDVDLIFAGDDVCYLNNGAGVFSAGPAISVAGISDPRGIGFADIDNDGDMDFAVGAKKSRNWLVRNDFNDGNWLKVRLISPQGLAGAFGAKTLVYPPNQAGGAVVGMRESRSNNGYLGQDDPILHFGLGALTAVDVVATFLDGTTITLRNVAAGQTITIDGRTADDQAPAISNIVASNLTFSSAAINWTTNEVSDSQVEYGLTTSYGVSTPLDPSLVTSHAVSLSNLQANTTYHYRVKSKDVAGNLAVSGDFTFTTLASDVTPPIISNVVANNIASSAATINWNTDEAADSQVEYGLTTSYGISTPLDPALVTSHAVSLSNLQANTTYHYRVKSKDAAGNLATSADFTFTTLSQPATIFADDFNAATLDLTKWNKGSNSGNQSAVVSNQLELRSSGSESGWVITKNFYTARNTAVSMKVTQPNNDGDLGISPTYNLSSPLGIFNETNWYRFYVYGNGPYRLFAQWKKSGVVSGVDVTGSLVINGAVYLRLRFDNTNIHFEASLDGVNWTDTYTEAFGLPGYTLDSPFYYELAAYKTTSNGVLKVDDFAINSSAPIPDVQPPQITGVAAQSISSSGAQIVWQTNEPADSQVEYGLTTSYGLSTPLDVTLVTSHTITLSGLQANTTYHYRVLSKDAASNLATSADNIFTTQQTGNVAFLNVQDVFSSCARCHQGAFPPAGLNLTAGQAYANIVNVPSTEYPQWQRVQPNNRAVSWLYEKIINPAPPVGSQMGGLTADEIELIGAWIDQGATQTPAPPYAALQFRTAVLPIAEINIAYTANLVVWGGLPPYQFNVISGGLPPGLSLDAATGLLSGFPNSVGQYSFTVRVSDSQSPAATLDQGYNIEVRNTQANWQVPAGFEIEAVVSNLHLTVNIAFAPNPGPNPTDPFFYVSLLYGDIVMVQRDFQTQVYATGLLNFVPIASFPGSGEMGVTGITVDPISGDVFASMVYEGTPGAGNMFNKVVRFHSADGGRTAATQATILSGIAAGISHQIQELTIGPDGKLYANVGDGWVPEAAPDLNDLRGKVLRMNLDGSIPADNPFPGTLVYATGFRNNFGADWRAADAQLYISDNGPEYDDRLAKVTAGSDYGWGLIAPDLTKGAIFLWNPTVAPVAMDFLENTALPMAYSGQLFVGLSGETYLQGPSTRGKKIWRFTLDGNGQVVSDSLFLDYTGAGKATVIGVAFGPDGLYFTDLYGENGFDQFGQTQGNIYRIRWSTGDVTAPVISNVQATAVKSSSATIVWQTDEPATRQIEYGPTAAYGNWTAYETNLLTSHSVTLNQLTPETTYHFRVWNWDASNNGAFSNDFTFTTTAFDTVAPIISNVRVDSLAANSALVTWSTNEATTGSVDFGTTTNYGSSVADANLAATHRLWLNGLLDGTLYHFRVRSSDAEGNATISGDSTFTTLISATLFADDFTGAGLDLNKWNIGSNSGNQSSVVSNQLELRANGSPQSGWVITKNNYAARHTAATVKVTQPNDDGALGISPTYSLASTIGIYDQANWYRFYIYRSGSSGPYRLFAQWKKSGVDNGLDVTGNLVINGAVYLRLRCDNTNIHFEASFDSSAWTDAYTEAFSLPGYTLDSPFYYELSAYYTSTNGVLTVDDFAVTRNSAASAASKPNAKAPAATPLPTSFALQNYPNPFNAATKIRFALPQDSEVELNIFDLVGRKVQTLNVGLFSAGNHEVVWNGRHRDGAELSSGIYLLRLRYRANQTTHWSQLVQRVMLTK